MYFNLHNDLFVLNKLLFYIKKNKPYVIKLLPYKTLGTINLSIYLNGSLCLISVSVNVELRKIYRCFIDESCL